jgi:hypothetical protein
MKTNYSISIPKPCHEDWSKMTPNEKGRFCKSCSKTVVDFTTMNVKEVQAYIHNNKNQRICGHIKQSQLDSINLRIPETVFSQNLSFHRLFLLALLVSMGILLFNCEDETGKTRKIESVEIVETPRKSNDTISTQKTVNEVKSDSVFKKEIKVPKLEVTEHQVMDGMMIVETVGDIEVELINEEDIETLNIDSLEIETPPDCPQPPIDEIVVGLLIVEHPPEIKNTPKDLTCSEKKKYLSKKISQIITDNFNVEIASDLSLKGKQRILTQFKITEQGNLAGIKVRGPHPILEKEARRVLNLLPKFKPGQQRSKNIGVIYSLPIVFIIED